MRMLLSGRDITHRQMREFDPIPWGWGVSWSIPELREYRIHPIPFNWVFGWFRDRFYFLSSGFRSKIYVQFESTMADDRSHAYNLGWEDHKKAVSKSVEDFLVAGNRHNP